MKLEFSEEERVIYQMVHLHTHALSLRHSLDVSQVEARSQAKFNRFLRAGTVLKVRFLSLNLFVINLTPLYRIITKFLSYFYACARFVRILL